MISCSKCHKETESEVLCPSCGFFVSDEVAATASKEDTLKALNSLQNNLFKKISKIDEKSVSLERMIKNKPTTYAYHKFFRFFWPFLVAAVPAFYISIYIFAKLSFAAVSYWLALLVAAIVIIVGFPVATSIQNKKNAVIAIEEENAIKMVDEAKKELETLQSQKRTTVNLIQRYKSIIPLKYLNSDSISQIIKDIENNKATTIIDAVNLRQ